MAASCRIPTTKCPLNLRKEIDKGYRQTLDLITDIRAGASIDSVSAVIANLQVSCGIGWELAKISQD